MDVERVRDALGHPGMAWLMDRLRARLAQGKALEGQVILQNPTEVQREALGRMMGRLYLEGSLSIELLALEKRLKEAGLCDTLQDAATFLLGEIPNRRAARDTLESQWKSVFDARFQPEQQTSSRRIMADKASRHPDKVVQAGAPVRSRLQLHEKEKDTGGTPAPLSMEEWLEQVRASGLVRRLAGGDPVRGEHLLRQLHALTQFLPANGMPLAELSARVTGNSHALDQNAPLGTLCLSLLEHQLGSIETEEPFRRRSLWASVGVLCDALSAPVLVLNLRAEPQTVTGRALNLHADAGEPYRLSVRQLLRDPPIFDSAITGERVYVCENPVVVEAAAIRLGLRARPLVCTEGNPKTAVHLLLRLLTSAGISLYYHGDFDHKGLEIAGAILRRYRAHPWRLSALDYREAAAEGGNVLDRLPAEVPWDPALKTAMAHFNRGVHEEQVLEGLLRDLEE